MTKLQQKFATAIATSAVLAQALVVPAFATSITVEGNGAYSDNVADVEFENTVNVNQNNDADIDNDVDVDANTGNNSTSYNTGGNSNVTSGNATTTVDVVNSANTNQAQVNNCCLPETTVSISGNGAYSDNNVWLDAKNDVDIDQDNDADFDNDIDVDAKTGRNDANYNTGGDSSVTSGDATVTVAVSNFANANSAVVGGGHGAGTLSAVISGNGAFSDNEIDLEFENDVDVDQDNDADFDNDVDVDADTGWNDANFNTGGDSDVVSGDADVTVTIDNMANFNLADIEDCGCFEDLEASIMDNGAFSDNEIEFETDSDLDVDQDNDADFDNDVDVDAETGKNDADYNTGGDSDVESGDSTSDVTLTNESNLNAFGGDVEFEFDFDDLWSWLTSHV